MEEVHTQYLQKINVWCGIIGRHIVGGNLTSDKYLPILQKSIIPRLRQIYFSTVTTQIYLQSPSGSNKMEHHLTSKVMYNITWMKLFLEGG